MNAKLTDIWVYLAPSPLLGLSLTLMVYLGAVWLFERSGRKPLLNPVLVAVTALVGILLATDTSYDTYFAGAQFVHFLLGPATVALAVPLYANVQKVRRLLLPLLISLLAGSIVAALSAVMIAKALGVSRPVLLSLAPKSATSPVAMGVAEQIGGVPSLTAVLVILTGVIGAVLAPGLLRLLRVKDDAAQGFAIGVAAHGIGTARAFQLGETAGAFAGLAMGLNALATALLVPLLVRVFV
jgi:predicted murein hydrolase (TIGR00659 family)